jgi:DNA-binding transcriptional MerR regulator
VSRRYLRTSEIAEAAGVHPNTVRLYEKWGFLPPVPRSAGNYRLFTEAHRDQMLLARTLLREPYPGRVIKASAVGVARKAATGDLGGALEMAYDHLAVIRSERAQADAAVALLERWARGIAADATSKPLRVGQAAKLLGVSTDMLRNWERNGLLDVPRNPANGYRQYRAPQLGRLRIIRMLSRAGYSQMAILRMLLRLERGEAEDLHEALDLPAEDVYVAADRWQATLDEMERRALSAIEQLEAMIEKGA